MLGVVWTRCDNEAVTPLHKYAHNYQQREYPTTPHPMTALDRQVGNQRPPKTTPLKLLWACVVIA